MVAERDRILFADDDASFRRVVAFMLDEAGYAVDEAADGVAALRAFDPAAHVAVVTDLTMPGADGLALMAGVLGAAPRMPVIVVTAHDDPETESRCIELGAEDYITKPIRPATLVARVRAVLRRAYGGGTG